MNCYTKMIMDDLKVGLETALKVQYKMMCADLSFSNASRGALRRAAKAAYEELGDDEMRAVLDRQMGA